LKVGRYFDRFGTVARFADYRNFVRIRENAAEPAAHQGVVVDQQN
jgi:hypothetical protein